MFYSSEHFNRDGTLKYVHLVYERLICIIFHEIFKTYHPIRETTAHLLVMIDESNERVINGVVNNHILFHLLLLPLSTLKTAYSESQGMNIPSNRYLIDNH